MTEASSVADQSHRDQTRWRSSQHSGAGPPDTQGPAAAPSSLVEIELDRVGALDYYEALVLLNRSEITAEDVAPDGLAGRVDRLCRAMEGAESLCGVVEDPSVTVTVGLTGAEAATMLLALAVAAAYYRSEDCPDTAEVYERGVGSLLSTIFDHVADVDA